MKLKSKSKVTFQNWKSIEELLEYRTNKNPIKRLNILDKSNNFVILELLNDYNLNSNGFFGTVNFKQLIEYSTGEIDGEGISIVADKEHLIYTDKIHLTREEVDSFFNTLYITIDSTDSLTSKLKEIIELSFKGIVVKNNYFNFSLEDWVLI